MGTTIKPLHEIELLRLMRGPKAKRITVQEWNGDEWVKLIALDRSRPYVHRLIDLGWPQEDLQNALDAIAADDRRRQER